MIYLLTLRRTGFRCVLASGFLLLLCVASAQARAQRVVVIKVDGLPYDELNRFVQERDPRTGKGLLPWTEEVFYRNGTRVANFYVRGMSLSGPSWSLLDTGQHLQIKGNVEFDGPGKDEDFGLEQITGTSLDRYKFRTSPLRNAALQPAFFHNGAYTRLEEAIRFHINTNNAARNYNAAAEGVDVDLRGRLGPIEPVLQRLDPKLVVPISLSPSEFSDLGTFVRDGLLDRAALKENLCKLAPSRVPSGLRTMVIEGCGDNDDER